MASVAKSPYVDVARFSQGLESHVTDLVTLQYEASNKGADSISWNIRAPGPRSLMDSQVECRIPIIINPQGCTQFLRMGGSDLLKQKWASGEYTGAEIEGNVLLNTDALLIQARKRMRPGKKKNYGVAERETGIWQSVSSVVIEINGTSISYSPDQFCQLGEMFLRTKEDDRNMPQGAQDSGSGGCFVERRTLCLGQTKL